LAQAAQTAVQVDGPLKSFYERIKHRRGSKVAKVAVARENRIVNNDHRHRRSFAPIRAQPA
jgi:hypothetical protein